jgi:hypothetical protein
MKKRATAITKGCADCKAILVAAEAEAHSTAKINPIPASFQLIKL